MTTHNAIFSEDELAFVKARAGTMTNEQLCDALSAQFKRSDITPSQIRDCCGSRGWRRGVIRRYCETRKSFIGAAGDLMVAVDTLEGFRRAQQIMWEELIGPIPKGYRLIPLNGDKLDFDPLNWIMLTNSMANRLRQSPFFAAAPELRPTIFAMAKLKQALHDRTGKRQRPR